MVGWQVRGVRRGIDRLLLVGVFEALANLWRELRRRLLAGWRDHLHLLGWANLPALLGNGIGQLRAEQDDDADHVDPEQQRHRRADWSVAANHVVLLEVEG